MSTIINDYKFHTLEDVDGEGSLAISTSLEEGRTTLSVHEAPGGVVMVKVDDLLEILGGKAEPEVPKVERHSAVTNEKVVRTDEYRTFEVTDRIWKDKTLKIRAGGLGDNLVLDDRENGFHFTLGLATVEAIVKEHGLKPGPELTVLTRAEAETAERPEWLEAEVIRAELDGEFVFAVRDEDNDWLLYGGKCDGDYVVDGEAEDEFSDVEIVKA